MYISKNNLRIKDKFLMLNRKYPDPEITVYLDYLDDLFFIKSHLF